MLSRPKIDLIEIEMGISENPFVYNCILNIFENFNDQIFRYENSFEISM